MAAVSENRENPVDDSTLSSLMDDLQEGTLLSLLEDSDLFSYLQDYPLSPTDTPDAVRDGEKTGNDFDLAELFGDHMELVEYGCQVSGEGGDGQEQNAAVDTSVPTVTNRCHSESPKVTKSGYQRRMKTLSLSHSGSDTDVSSLDSNDSDTAEANFSFVQRPRKRLKLEERSKTSQDQTFLVACVAHDHSYTSKQQEFPSSYPSITAKDAVLNAEEGSCSDAGYETMSTSTSPGSNTSISSHSSSPTQVIPPVSQPLPSRVAQMDPVALIDARIKHFMCRHQVNLTEEEKETLKAEGLPIPTTLPLTKVEERALKTVRRKIRNKVAAQESRKRKKQYLHELEDRVRQCTCDNLRLKKKVENLESENRSLTAQLQKFQALVAGATTSSHTTKAGACLMVIMLCFAMFLGGWAPTKFSYWTTPSHDYATTTVRSRSLLSLDDSESNLPQAACNWFRYIFVPEKHLQIEDSVQDSPPQHTWPDIYFSSTPLGVHRNNDSHRIVLNA